MSAEIPADCAAIDQILDGRTTLLLAVPSEDALHVPVGALSAGVAEDDWLVLDSEILIVGIDERLTRSRASDISERMDDIRQERCVGRFER